MPIEQEAGKFRCPWCLGFEDYVKYHDEEWGVPVFDDQKQFEFLVLESAQAGLSWSTILKKRKGYRKAFAEFDYNIVADLPDEYVQELLLDTGIIRNEMKIRAAINNARRLRKNCCFYSKVWLQVLGLLSSNHANFWGLIELSLIEKSL